MHRKNVVPKLHSSAKESGSLGMGLRNLHFKSSVCFLFMQKFENYQFNRSYKDLGTHLGNTSTVFVLFFALCGLNSMKW